MKGSIENKTKHALVTGGSRGIGKAVCIQLAKDTEYHILINYNSNKLEALNTLKEVKSVGGNGEILQFNVVNVDEVKSVLDAWNERNKDAVIEVLVVVFV